MDPNAVTPEPRVPFQAVQDLTPYLEQALAILEEIRAEPVLDHRALRSILRRHPLDGRAFFNKNILYRAYDRLCREGRLAPEAELEKRLRMKPTRTLSGLAPVTVLTRPHPCPGSCIFCPTYEEMPKSYLPQEPGAQRAAQNGFDPHAQVAGRIRSLAANGHPVDKIELLILGGTWSSYPKTYQEEFIRRCLDAMNGFNSASLEEAQRANETAPHRNVGLVIETRPDHVTPREIGRLRGLGVTKVQLGVQSLDDAVLERNRRGHDADAVRRALNLLRRAAFKLVVHWMPNLLGATPEGDLRDFERLWEDPALRPDELKIYPCSLVERSELFEIWKRGEYEPYTDEVLVRLVAECKKRVPPYCRINRVFRDIPSTYILAGCRQSNLREEVHRRMAASGDRCRCIRCREVRGSSVGEAELVLDRLRYETSWGEEHFLSFTAPGDRVAGYTRLSLPRTGQQEADPVLAVLPELTGAALIRAVHVYGPALHLGAPALEDTQHRGLGTRLLLEAEETARGLGYTRMAVIASLGTRPYYFQRGYRREGTYMVKPLGR